jgi:hypothetical protein
LSSECDPHRGDDFPPSRPDNMMHPGGYQHQGAVTIGNCGFDTSSSPDLLDIHSSVLLQLCRVQCCRGEPMYLKFFSVLNKVL